MDRDNQEGRASGSGLAALSVAALGVVYGDIGTSPLYAVRESFNPSYGLAATAPNVLGVLSLVFWSLVLVISIKYVALVLRADNGGEGGILALTALVSPLRAGSPEARRVLVLLGLLGAALLYGDGMITPAISVLSAVEGLRVAAPVLGPWVIPAAVVILVALFLFQSRGTPRLGRIFGPLMLVWFAVVAGLGVREIAREPGVLLAMNPLHAVRFFGAHGLGGFLVLGSVFLVVTGGEMLYADMGHFGRRAVGLAWFLVVLPALLLNYFGQGALLLREPGALASPFYLMAPGWALLPLILLATAATIIASRAVISGAFSLARQSVQLGCWPRLDIRHTSSRRIRQVYVPEVNWSLMVAAVGLVLGFGTSSDLAAAYGVAVSTTMVITTVLFWVVVRDGWRWPPVPAAAMAAVFLAVDLSFWAANLAKLPDGGWFPLLVAGGVLVLMTTWRTGRRKLSARIRTAELPLAAFLEDVAEHPPWRVPGTAVFMSDDPEATPRALLHNLEHNRVLHERVVFLAVATEEVPRVSAAERATVRAWGGGFHSVVLHYGFMEDVDVPGALARLDPRCDLEISPMKTTYFLGRDEIAAGGAGSTMARWRKRLFAFMRHNAHSPTDFFRLPPNQVVELGALIELG